jgi:hypothetical protein
MTVAPSSSPEEMSSRPSRSSTPPAFPPTRPEGLDPAWLAGDLLRRVQAAAAASGLSIATLCEQWVREGLDHFESHQAAVDPDGSGRCSLRTGTCSLGPVPLPVQQ